MRKVGFIISPGYQPMGFAVATPFEIANRQAAEPAYDIRMLSQHGGPVHTSLGFHVLTEPFADEPYDLIIVGASMQDASPETMNRCSDSRCAAIYCCRTLAHTARDGKAANHQALQDTRGRVPMQRIGRPVSFRLAGTDWNLQPG
jgi:transcriptional regulator GlxA family with amidase domain